jgi:hypothetical protein
MDDNARYEWTAKSDALRSELKSWEKIFAGENDGRKAGREDIKKHPDIGRFDGGVGMNMNSNGVQLRSTKSITRFEISFLEKLSLPSLKYHPSNRHHGNESSKKIMAQPLNDRLYRHLQEERSCLGMLTPMTHHLSFETYLRP